jgi:two-component sensor histidine kinase
MRRKGYRHPLSRTAAALGRAACFLAFMSAGIASAAPFLPLKVVESSHTNFGHPLSELVDGKTDEGNGLDMSRVQFKEQEIIFAAEGPVSAQAFQFTSWHDSVEPAAYPAEMEIAVTSDENPSRLSNWTPLKPGVVMTHDFAISPGIASIRANSIELSGGRPRIILTSRATSPLTGVTGFRLRLIPHDTGHISGQKTLGRSKAGNCVINEFQVVPDPLRSTNIALGRPVNTPGETYSTLPRHLLTDGFPATFSHPNDSHQAKGFYFEVDLGTTHDLDHVVLLARLDGEAADRLGNYEVQVFDDAAGKPGNLRWTARMRADGSSVPVGGSDRIIAKDGQGKFSGRFVRITNPTEFQSRPQIAEVEIYPDLKPKLVSIRADGRLPDPEGRLTPGARSVAFSIAPGDDDPAPELLHFRWRRAGGEWAECHAGELVIMPCAIPGTYPVEFQSRHTDGVWNHGMQRHDFIIPLPWWQRPLRIGAILMALGLGTAGLLWWSSLRKLREKLRRAQAVRVLEQDRLRIARDMHDDIGARLTHLALLADRVKRTPGQEGEMLSKIAREARGTVGALDQIVWAVNPQHDTIGGLIDYMCSYSTEYLSAANLSCRFELSAGKREAVVPFSIRHPLLMAIKEALQNVVKHAGATRVVVGLMTTGTTLQITVTDNGSGFVSPSDSGNFQDGVNNMHARLAEIGGDCSISTSETGGTRVVLSVPWKSES